MRDRDSLPQPSGIHFTLIFYILFFLYMPLSVSYFQTCKCQNKGLFISNTTYHSQLKTNVVDISCPKHIEFSLLKSTSVRRIWSSHLIWQSIHRAKHVSLVEITSVFIPDSPIILASFLSSVVLFRCVGHPIRILCIEFLNNKIIAKRNTTVIMAC